MTLEEIRECEAILLGQGNTFPDQIDADMLCHKILGFEDMEGGDQEGDEEEQG